MEISNEKSLLKEWAEKGMKEGMERGRKETSVNIALNMLREGISTENIMQFTGLTLDEIRELTNLKT